MSNKVDCTWLPAFAAGDLNQQERVQFQKHLTQCPRCNQAWEDMSSALSQYRQNGEAPLPQDGLERLQETTHQSSTQPKRTISSWRYASAAILALAFFASGFWMGRGSANQPLPTALHLPLNLSPGDLSPELIPPPFTVALAESIPRVFSHSGTFPR